MHPKIAERRENGRDRIGVLGVDRRDEGIEVGLADAGDAEGANLDDLRRQERLETGNEFALNHGLKFTRRSREQSEGAARR